MFLVISGGGNFFSGFCAYITLFAITARQAGQVDHEKT